MDENYAKYLLKKTQKDYNLIAREFSRTRSVIWPELGFLFDRYLENGDRVLDLGCGNGRFYRFFSEKKTRYIGVDFSHELIKIAKRKYPLAVFQFSDGLNLLFSDNYFDKVFSIAVFHHIPSKKFRLKFLKETKRVLKPKGFFILIVWKLPFLKELSLLIKYSILKLLGRSKLDRRDIFLKWGNKTQRYYHLFSKRELKGLLKKSGFNIIEIGIVKSENKRRKNIYAVCQKPPL